MALFKSSERPARETPAPLPPPPPPPVAEFVEEAESVLGRGVSIRGDMTFEGSMRLEGKIEGRIVAQGRFTVAPGALVLGDVTAAEAVIEGVVRGNITATDKIVVAATGEVAGDLSSVRLVVKEGGKLLGAHDVDSASMSQPPPMKEREEPARPARHAKAAAQPVKAGANSGSADPFAGAL
jgi:cytoskeletal protein CcmA (bactofilin family)